MKRDNKNNKVTLKIKRNFVQQVLTLQSQIKTHVNRYIQVKIDNGKI